MVSSFCLALFDQSDWGWVGFGLVFVSIYSGRAQLSRVVSFLLPSVFLPPCSFQPWELGIENFDPSQRGASPPTKGSPEATSWYVLPPRHGPWSLSLSLLTDHFGYDGFRASVTAATTVSALCALLHFNRYSTTVLVYMHDALQKWIGAACNTSLLARSTRSRRCTKSMVGVRITPPYLFPPLISTVV